MRSSGIERNSTAIGTLTVYPQNADGSLGAGKTIEDQDTNYGCVDVGDVSGDKQLVVQTGGRAAREKTTQSDQEFADWNHGAPSARSSRAMTSTIRCQSSASRASCLRPSRVSE